MDCLKSPRYFFITRPANRMCGAMDVPGLLRRRHIGIEDVVGRPPPPVRFLPEHHVLAGVLDGLSAGGTKREVVAAGLDGDVARWLRHVRAGERNVNGAGGQEAGPEGANGIAASKGGIVRRQYLGIRRVEV